MGEALTMADWEIDRLHIIRQVLERRFTWTQAAAQMGLSRRQVGRLCIRVRGHGARGVIHGLRGKPSNHRLEPEMLGKVLSALHDPLWEGFRPTFAREKLAERHGLCLGIETVRQLMLLAGLWLPRRQRARHQRWRPRRECSGMLVQMDGSHHDWFEGRGPRCVLMGLIDDATSLVQLAKFVPSEDTHNVMRVSKAYIERYGRPTAFYVDKHSIFRTNREASIDEDLRQEQPATQYKRALDALGIELIWAHSPQAKGRIERTFQTHQDRLVKELRLAGISTMEAGNLFLQQHYLPGHNERFAVAPANPTDAHRPLLDGQDLDRAFSVWSERTVQNDFTVRLHGSWLQLLPPGGLRVRPRDKVTLEKRLDGSIHVRWRERYMPFKMLDKQPHRPFCAPRPFPTREEVVGARRHGFRRLLPRQRRLLGLAGRRKKSWHEMPQAEVHAPAFL